jgi:hypothetical protein
MLQEVLYWRVQHSFQVEVVAPEVNWDTRFGILPEVAVALQELKMAVLFLSMAVAAQESLSPNRILLEPRFQPAKKLNFWIWILVKE